MESLRILILVVLIFFGNSFTYNGLKASMVRYRACKMALDSTGHLKDRIGKLVGTSVLSASIMLGELGVVPVNAYGPTEVALKDLSYKQVELCNGEKPIMPGQKAMEGLFAACIEVEATAVNPSSKSLPDVSVYGFIKDKEAGNSVLPNNPDFRSDAGQYAMIKTVPAGESKVKFQFVAAVTANTAKGEPLPGLIFFNTKAVSYPGGSKFKALDPCEIDPRADGCNTDVYGDDDE